MTLLDNLSDVIHDRTDDETRAQVLRDVADPESGIRELINDVKGGRVELVERTVRIDLKSLASGKNPGNFADFALIIKRISITKKLNALLREAGVSVSSDE